MTEAIKGYVQFFDDKIPVTWNRETEKFVYDVRRVFVQNDIVQISERVFDDKIPKKEIYYSKSELR